MTVGGASGSPAVFQGKAADRGRGWGIDAFSEVSRRHAAPRRGNRQGKAFAKSMERRDPSGLANASWGHTRGSQGAGYLSLPRPFPPPPYRPESREQAGKGICKIHGKAGSQWLGKCILGSHTGVARGEGGALTPSPTFPAAAMPPRAGGIGRERYLQNPWKGGIPVAWQMHLGGTHGGRKGQGRGIGPLTWASRHRRGGLPIRSSEGDRPHMGQGGI
ncbi:hypothetical protein WP8S18E04_16260 [Aeromonas caviae]|nr:hypothetical protein WP8S18E04_16260 [Aeromonas caviae]